MKTLHSIIADVCKVQVKKHGRTVNDYRNETDLAINLQKMQVGQQVADLIKQQFSSDRGSVDSLVQSKVDDCDDISELVDLTNTRYFQSPADKNQLADLLRHRYELALKEADTKEKEEEARKKYDELMASLSLKDKEH